MVEKTLQAVDTLRSEIIEALETKLNEAEETIRSQNNEINNLKSNVNVLVGQLRKLTLSANRPKTEGALEANGTNQPMSAALDQAIVSSDLFDQMVNELTQIIGPLATTVVYHDVTALGESVELFPKRRLPELLDIVTNEISDENLKHTFRKRFVENVQLLDR